MSPFLLPTISIPGPLITFYVFPDGKNSLLSHLDTRGNECPLLPAAKPSGLRAVRVVLVVGGRV